jgi:hypothetical protein
MYDCYDETTWVCPHCAASIDSTHFSAARRTCPQCGAAIKMNSPAPCADVARVRNLAEAGFLTDELVGRGIDAWIHQLDEFNASSDHWGALYLIRVPFEAADEAAALIRQYVDDDAQDRQTLDGSPEFSLSNHVLDPLFWRPVALIVLTGIASFGLGQRFSAPKADRRLPSNSLPSAVNDISRPLTTEPEAGKPRYRLSFDSRQQAWLLDTDRDDDGHYDERQQFHASGTAW